MNDILRRELGLGKGGICSVNVLMRILLNCAKLPSSSAVIFSNKYFH